MEILKSTYYQNCAVSLLNNSCYGQQYISHKNQVYYIILQERWTLHFP